MDTHRGDVISGWAGSKSPWNILNSTCFQPSCLYMSNIDEEHFHLGDFHLNAYNVL